MTIDNRIEIMRELLNNEIVKNKCSLNSSEVINISKELDELIVEQYIQKKQVKSNPHNGLSHPKLWSN